MVVISVIVPVYKVEPYLHRCVDSILAQTFTDFELILVDDGSPDNCPAICDEYAAKDTRVKVIHKPNGGVSSARNAGLDIATGKYVTFVDSDDWLNNTFLNDIIIGDEDLVCQTAVLVDENGGLISNVERIPFRTNELSNDVIGNHTLLGTFNWTHCKRFKMGIIREHSVFFDTMLNFGEDTLFAVSYALYAHSMRVDNTANYCYVQYSSRSTLSNVYSQNRLAVLQNANRKIAAAIFLDSKEKQMALYVNRMTDCYNSRLSYAKKQIGKINFIKWATILYSYAQEDDFYFVVTNGALSLSPKIIASLKKRNRAGLLWSCFCDTIEHGINKCKRMLTK